MRRVRLAQFSAAQLAALRAVDDNLGQAAAYLVGGAVRDALLRRAFDDLDVAVTSGACALARRIAERAGGAYVELDAGRGAARAGPRVGGATVQGDVTDFRGSALADDLAGPDLTLHALAAPGPGPARRR